ncbi:MAG: hypothetical protein JNM07_04745 [Phycisphaerae bacterium]|nr:hypothetical protein [Phycisphaerae bacterium]
MDKRHQQIEEGKGLVESRLNVEFVDFLRKWSTPIVTLVAVTALAFMGWNKYSEYKVAARDKADTQLNDAERSSSPSSLLAFAGENAAAYPSLAMRARLDAANIYLSAAVRGLRPASPLNADGTPQNAEDLLTAQSRDEQLGLAAAEYQRVLDGASGKPEYVLHTLNSLFGLGAVAECKGEFDTAKGLLDRAKSVAKAAGFPGLAATAEKRLATLDDLKDLPRLLSRSEIPSYDVPKQPVPGPAVVPADSTLTEPSLSLEPAPKKEADEKQPDEAKPEEPVKPEPKPK